MRIVSLEIDGYGVWSGLKIERLSETLNVFHGPNEAGKTTLLQFIRSVLYGFSPERRRYLPPAHGGAAGGALDVLSPHGPFQIRRIQAEGQPGHSDGELLGGDSSPGEQLTLTAPDGARQGEHFIKVLLANVEEATFNNVFAIGLREIQELATLSDTAAAELLYNLSVGLDRVSLVEVLRELDASRNRVVDAAGGPCQVAELLAEREKLRSEIEELDATNHRWSQLAAQRDRLQADITRLEEEANGSKRQAELLELAVAAHDLFARRTAIDQQLAELEPAAAMPARALQRLDRLQGRIRKRQERIDGLAKRRRVLRQEYAGLPIDEPLERQAARIRAIREQEPWIGQVQAQIGELEKEIGRHQAELAAEGQRLGLGSEPAALATLSQQKLRSLRLPARQLREAAGRCRKTREAAAAAQSAAQSLIAQIEAALAARGQKEWTAALDQAGSLVSQLRRRGQLDERLAELARHQTDLETRGRRLVDRQVLPIGVLGGLGGAFVGGFMLVLVGLLMPSTIIGPAGWVLAVLGLVGLGAAVAVKTLLERTNAKQLEALQKQLELMRSQVRQGEEDRDALDARLPAGGAGIANRLEAAEKDLAALEALAPLDAQQAAARQDAETAQRRAGEDAVRLRAARRAWRDALATAGLGESLRPKGLRRLLDRFAQVSDLQRRLAECRDQLAGRRRELESFGERIAQLAADAGVTLSSTDPIERLHALAEAAERQEAAAARRGAIRRDVRRLRAAEARHEEAVGRLKHRRRALFLEAGVRTEQEFRQRALESARADALGQERDAIAAQIQSLLASRCSEDAIRQQLESGSPAELDARRKELCQRVEGVSGQLRGMLEQRGRMAEQLDALVADKRLASKHLDLAVVEKRLEDAIGRWQVLATACSLLDAIRSAYETSRQPEALQEASGYLQRLTQDRYRRVWAPLGEHALRVDDAEGRAAPVERLSRGTREQLFLSLRLALAASFARRGAPLPLVLDDVLVNFDADRAKAAAAVLRDFAAAGHQLLVFTCHEHISKLFQSLKTPVIRLPANTEPARIVVVPDRPAADEKPKRERQPRRPRQTAAKGQKAKADDLSSSRDDLAEGDEGNGSGGPQLAGEPTASDDQASWNRDWDGDVSDSDANAAAA